MYRITFAFLVLATPCLADASMDSFKTAKKLGAVIGSEKACGLTLDQTGIQRWIATHVPPEDMEFSANPQLIIETTEYDLSAMGGSSLTAHCAAVLQTARHNGLLKP